EQELVFAQDIGAVGNEASRRFGLVMEVDDVFVGGPGGDKHVAEQLHFMEGERNGLERRRIIVATRHEKREAAPLVALRSRKPKGTSAHSHSLGGNDDVSEAHGRFSLD